MAFFQTDRPPRAPFLNVPPAVLWLIGALVGAHLLRAMLPDELSEAIIFDYGLIPARYAVEGDAGGAIGLGLPFLTYMFIHGDLTHVGLNSLWLLVFGPGVAARLGGPKFLLFFLFCGVVAALVHLVVYWGSPVAVVGASGGVSGLMGAGMRILYGRLYGGPNGLASVFSKPILVFSLVWIIANVVGGVLRIGVTDDLTLVAWVAHLGGYFGGLAALGPFDRLPFGGRELGSA